MRSSIAVPDGGRGRGDRHQLLETASIRLLDSGAHFTRRSLSLPTIVASFTKLSTLYAYQLIHINQCVRHICMIKVQVFNVHKTISNKKGSNMSINQLFKSGGSICHQEGFHSLNYKASEFTYGLSGQWGRGGT